MKNNYGIKVTVEFKGSEGYKKGFYAKEVYRNVTKIRYYDSQSWGRKQQIAFESDIHGTDIAWNLSHIEEFEIELECSNAESF